MWHDPSLKDGPASREESCIVAVPFIEAEEWGTYLRMALLPNWSHSQAEQGRKLHPRHLLKKDEEKYRALLILSLAVV